MPDKLLYATKYLSLWERTAETKDGKPYSYSMVARGNTPPPPPEEKRPDAAIIVAILNGDEPRLVLVDEYRVPIGGREIAFPAGLIDEADYDGLEADRPDLIIQASLRAARRELKEETGLNFIPHSVSPKNLYSSGGMSNESCIIWFGSATGTPTSKLNEGTEDIRVLLPTFPELLELMEQDLAFSRLAWPMLWAFKIMGGYTIAVGANPHETIRE